MKRTLRWLRTHSFESHTIAFLLMMLPPLPMFLAAQKGALGWIGGLLALVILGNLMELAIK